MANHGEFRHDSYCRFAFDDQDNDDFSETEDIVTEGKGFTESTTSELPFRKVMSDKEACELYNSYAFKHGFGTRKALKRTREDKKTIRLRTLVCSYAGFKKVKSDSVYQKKDYHNGCKAFIQFDVDKETGLYHVVKHEMEHNHSRVPISKRHLIRSHRKIGQH
ncbi:protein FAR1-RELATED SEQUENCE 5-like [Chenopodium quinoa]|uniref:protein FAR1-RELATED SEQUENCE 5-like n=1 Tax=Chenopodium quinoa TaxID=63459 RepID=UPI000B78783D|nr:protein FAR1-RELATED SEQUENCE 5-like [Chenopodium quinoa]